MLVNFKLLKRKIKTFEITKSGVWFYYKGDTVLWRWWWRRNPPQPRNCVMRQQGKYVSSLCESCFNSLKEIDNFWEEYRQYCAEEQKNEKNN